MKKTLVTILIVLGLTLIVIGLSVGTFPQWISLPGGILLLLIGAFTGVAELGEKLKGWREFLFGDKENNKPSLPTSPQKYGKQNSTIISGNKMFGRNKIKVQQNDVSITENIQVGENEITVGNKSSQLKTKLKGKRK